MNKKIFKLFLFFILTAFTSVPVYAAQMVDIGNANINTYQEGSGTSTIVFDTGYGDAFDYKDLPDQKDVWNGLQDT